MTSGRRGNRSGTRWAGWGWLSGSFVHRVVVSSAVSGGALVGISGCEERYSECQYVCEADIECPGGFRCDMNAAAEPGQGLCSSTPMAASAGQCPVAVTTSASPTPDVMIADAGVVTDIVPENTTDVAGGPNVAGDPDVAVAVTTDVEAVAATPETVPDASFPEPCEEYNTVPPQEICLPRADGGSDCLTLTERMQNALVQWLDPTSLLSTAEGSVDWWCDRSGKGNHAQTVLPQEDYPMRISQDGEEGLAAQVGRSMTLEGNWLLLDRDPTALVFGEEDFLVMVGAAIARPGELVPGQKPDPFNLFRSEGLASYTMGLVVDSLGAVSSTYSASEIVELATPAVDFYDDKFRNFALRRVGGTTLQLRIDGILQDQGTLPASLALNALQATSGLGTSAFNSWSTSRGRIRSAVVFRGGLSAAEVETLERYSCRALALCPDLVLP